MKNITEKKFRVQVINYSMIIATFHWSCKARLTRIRTFPTAEESAAGWLIGQTRERKINTRKKVERGERNFFLPWILSTWMWSELNSLVLWLLLCVLISRNFYCVFVTRHSSNKQFRKCKRWKVNNWTNTKVDKLLIFGRPWKLSKDIQTHFNDFFTLALAAEHGKFVNDIWLARMRLEAARKKLTSHEIFFFLILIIQICSTNRRRFFHSTHSEFK